MKEFNSNFKGIFIPKNILLDNKLTHLDKLVLSIIKELDLDDSHCTVNNEYLAKICDCSLSAIVKSVRRIRKLKYIETKKHSTKDRIVFYQFN